MDVLLVIGITFLLCWLADKFYVKVFRSKPQHMSGKAVRLNKYYSIGGLVLIILGVAAIFTGVSDGWLLTAGGVMLSVLGAGLVVYYMTFGVFYDDDSFILTTFGKKSATYRYRDIISQQLYNSYGQTIIELYLSDGRSVQLQSTMTEVYSFLDYAFEAWLRQTGRQKESCDFYDPDNCCWFPQGREK